MCGFAGLIGRALQERFLQASFAQLARRGPDSQRSWVAADQRAGLVHARLAIVDPFAHASQPFADASGQVHLCFNGEIYNYVELRASLAYPFQTQSDTEVILACYLIHGVAGLNLLKGMFSLALVDARSETLILVRDSIGKKPLFVGRSQRAEQRLLSFGSTILALRAMQHAASFQPAAVREEALHDYWQHSHLPPTQTAFVDIEPVLPGEVWQFDLNGRLLHKGKLEPIALLQYGGEDLIQTQRNVHTLLTRAVEQRMRGVEHITTLLSGGIDSTVVSAMLAERAKLTGQPIHALTLAALIPNTNDERYARYAARREQLTMTRLPIRSDHLAERVARSFELQDEPLGFISFYMLSELVREARQYGKILYSGDGGDEGFLGYGSAQDWQRNNPRDSGLAPVLTADLVGAPLPNWISDWGRQMCGFSLLGHGFTKTDRASAEQGVELRSPLLDWDLIAYARSIPVAQLLADAIPKALLKRELHDWPQWFVQRKKLGFSYNLRWRWAMNGFRGFRELLGEPEPDLLALLPPELRRSPRHWRSIDLFRQFPVAWKALGWQQFRDRTRRLDTEIAP